MIWLSERGEVLRCTYDEYWNRGHVEIKLTVERGEEIEGRVMHRNVPH